MAQLNGCDRIQKVAFHQHDICRFHGNICTCADGNADIRAGQCGRIVNAVADHGNLFAAFLQTAHFHFLILRQNLRNRLNPKLACNGVCRTFIIPCQHDNVNPHLMKAVHGFLTCGLQRISQTEDAEELFSLRKEQRCFALFRKLCRFFGEISEVDFSFLHHFQIAA